MTDRQETTWCVDCGARFTADETKGVYACPKCGSESVPCHTAQDLRVEVNWHELRILGIWAENYARQCAGKPDARNEKMPATVLAICRRLQRQHPDLTPLTLSEEIARLPKALEDAGIAFGGMETNVPRPQPLVVNGSGAVGHVGD